MTTLEDIKRDMDSEIDRIAIYGTMPSQEQLLRDFRLWSKSIGLIDLESYRQSILFETYEEQRLELAASRETISCLISKLEHIKRVVIDTIDLEGTYK